MTEITAFIKPNYKNHPVTKLIDIDINKEKKYRVYMYWYMYNHASLIEG